MSRSLAAALAALVVLAAGLTGPARSASAQPVQAGSADARAAQVMEALRASNWKKTIELATPLTTEHPENQLGWFALGYALHSQGKYAEALEPDQKAAAIQGTYTVDATYNAACALALLGRKDEAFEWLDKAREAGFVDVLHLDEDADLKDLHGDPRWDEFKAAMMNPSRGAPAKKAADKAPAAKDAGVMALTQSMDRGYSRIIWFDAKGPGPQISVDYGRADWKSEYNAAIEAGKLDGLRWRLGKDSWTTLDSNVDMKFGDVEVPAGQYYLVVSRAGGAYTLTFLDPAEIRRKKLDASGAKDTTGGIDVVIEHGAQTEEAATLAIELAKDDSAPNHGVLQIRFGLHRLWTKFSADLAR